MNPQPPVTNMRIETRTSSGAESALAVFPSWGERLADLKQRAAEIDWTPWAIVALGAILRFLFLGMKPPHFDEGINGWFVDQMVRNGFYRYDPTNYHGPLHFYVLFLSQTLLGRNILALRLPVVFVSIACVYLTMKFEPFVGRNVSRLAAVAMAVSPGFVFYGRYSIHEIWLQLFSMLFILGLIGLWRRGTPNYLWCVGMGLAGMILTKETYIIHVGCAVLAALVTWISHLLNRVPNSRPVPQTWTYLDLLLVVAAGAAAIVFFYSGTFFNWPGVKGLYQTFETWFKTGSNGNGHEKPWYYWLDLIKSYELPVAFGLLFSLFCPFIKNISLRYLAVYGVGTLIAYSIVRYKTPWCIIAIVWPLLFVFGAMLLIVPIKYRLATYISLGLVLWASLATSIRLNYFRCSTFEEPYVYVQTYNDIFKLTRPLLTLAKRDPTNYQLVGHLIRGSTYPFPWILGDFTKVGYYEHGNLPDKIDADFLLVQEDKIAEVEGKLHDSYYTEPLTIRPYQDTSKLYLSAKVFQSFYPGRAANFTGKPATP
ncbi:MAG TPA: flippase activity-associated protein Agl23 [Chthoniobacterales bacterium]